MQINLKPTHTRQQYNMPNHSGRGPKDAAKYTQNIPLKVIFFWRPTWFHPQRRALVLEYEQDDEDPGSCMTRHFAIKSSSEDLQKEKYKNSTR